LAREVRYAAEREESDRAWRRTLVRLFLACAAWLVAGLIGMAWSLHSQALEQGNNWFWLALVLGDGGALGTLAWFYTEGRYRGEW
jgi:drug/metabolite transporter (DMT)-like permease